MTSLRRGNVIIRGACILFICAPHFQSIRPKTRPQWDEQNFAPALKVYRIGANLPRFYTPSDWGKILFISLWPCFPSDRFEIWYIHRYNVRLSYDMKKIRDATTSWRYYVSAPWRCFYVPVTLFLVRSSWNFVRSQIWCPRIDLYEKGYCDAITSWRYDVISAPWGGFQDTVTLFLVRSSWNFVSTQIWCPRIDL